MAKEKNFQISTAIDYPSARFHLGHAYEKICTDVLARWKRLGGFKVHFSTGTDCHGLKIERAAEKAGKTPEKFVKEISAGFKELADVLNISYDDFIMTIEERHKKVVIKILKDLEKKGYIYKGKYEGLYCVDCETYYTEKNLDNGFCVIHKTKAELIKEETYFFKLSEFQEKLIDIFKNKDLLWPENKRNEMLNRLKEPLKDLSISREKVKWGISYPFEKDMTIFVWVEALMNYLSTVDYPNKKFKDFWPAVHVIGPDIVWHHTVIWYSILLALDLDLPKAIVHGFINLKGEKLSKAAGIIVDPIELAKKYSTDSLRYFLLRSTPFGEDGNFSEKVLISRHNNELADKLGNLVSRVSNLIEKNGMEKTEKIPPTPEKLKEAILAGEIEINEILSPNKKIGKFYTFHKDSKRESSQWLIGGGSFLRSSLESISLLVEKQIDNYEFDKALNTIFAFIDTCNQYVQDNKLWETKDKKKLYELKESILKISELLSPFLPETSEKIKKQFSAKKIKKSKILFKKI